MGKSDQPSRSKLMAWLAAFVVVFGTVSWLITMDVGFHGVPPTHPPTAPLGAPPTPWDCTSNQLEVDGIYNECATPTSGKPSRCDVYGQMLDEVLRFAGDNQAFALEIQIDGTYAGPGKYDLQPWPRPLGATPDVPKVALFAIGVFWQSVSGVVTVTRGDGRAGTVNAILQTSNGTTVVPGPTIKVIGAWSCS
ncbi:MAG: hypothetical protein WAL77_15375 [Candidatus Dormiibacterota bacterium]